MEKLITERRDGAILRYSVYNQEWTEEALEELRREHGVLFRADGAVPVRIRGTILSLGIEDDGVLSFGPDSPRFHVCWAPALIDCLREAVELLTPPAPAPEPAPAEQTKPSAGPEARGANEAGTVIGRPVR